MGSTYVNEDRNIASNVHNAMGMNLPLEEHYAVNLDLFISEAGFSH